MSEETKQKINKAAHNAFAAAGLEYDSWQPEIVPLFEIISEYSLFVTELADDQRLTSRRAIAAVGQRTTNLPIDDDKLSGFLYATQFEEVLDGWIFTEKSEPTVRRRFSAAHELGHYLLHFLPRLSGQPEGEILVLTEGVSFSSNETNNDTVEAKIHIAEDFESVGRIHFRERTEMEIEANQFAAEVLMPRNACLNAAEIYGRKFGSNKAVVARRMATEFFVSFEAMRHRLMDLGVYQTTAEV